MFVCFDYQVVDAFRKGTTRLVALVGEATGVGSSTVALDAAHCMLQRGWFPGGAVWVSATGAPHDSSTVLRRVGLAIGLGLQKVDLVCDEDYVIHELASCSKRTLFILDGLSSCNRDGCVCLSGGGPCASTCTQEAHSVARLLRASDHVCVLADNSESI